MCPAVIYVTEGSQFCAHDFGCSVVCVCDILQVKISRLAHINTISDFKKSWSGVISRFRTDLALWNSVYTEQPVHLRAFCVYNFIYFQYKSIRIVGK